MLSPLWRDILAISGLAVTVLGFAVAIFQLWRLRSTAEAAAAAAQGVKTEISRYDLARDVEAAIRTADYIKALIRHRNHDEALWRLGDLRVNLNGIRTAPQLRAGPSGEKPVDFQTHLVNLSTLESELERLRRKPDEDWSPDRARQVLTQLVDDLGEEGGKLRYAVSVGAES